MPSDIPVPLPPSEIPVPTGSTPDGKKISSKETQNAPKEARRTRHWLAAIGKEDLGDSPARKAPDDGADGGDPLAEALIAEEDDAGVTADSSKQTTEVPMETSENKASSEKDDQSPRRVTDDKQSEKNKDTLVNKEEQKRKGSPADQRKSRRDSKL